MARQRPTRIPTPHVLPTGAPGLLMGPYIVEIDRIVIRDVQYQFDVNRCRNEIVARTDRRTDGGNNHIIPTFSPKSFQGSTGGYDGRTDGRKTEITTISPLLLKKALG
ncbi:hypothetical protein DPMN_059499 [Dreissena polymorpha]|uniref:Uncharacterized protein n=1 Tax=Dreissena polymorpha TaxID=45954 RepID=A0A9D4C3Z2_DREPO|nr:hypothetical protein DPMN_059499 [Dreissena polymorpha]